MLLRGGPGIGPPWSLFKSTFWTFRRVGGDDAEPMLRVRGSGQPTRPKSALAQPVNLYAMRGVYGVRRVADLPGSSLLHVARQTALEISPDLITDFDVVCYAKEK